MSTLTSSPSPAASPRSSFHIQRPGYPNYTIPSPSPKQRAFNAPPPTYHHAASSGAGARARQPKDQSVESAASEKTSRYVDEGTQYSPDGFPPTAASSEVSSKGKEKEQELPSATPVESKKRKERPESYPSEPMSTSTTSSSGSSFAAPPARLPLEPEPRRDPTPAPSQSTAPPSQSNEPQEARSTHGHSSAPQKRSKPSPSGTAKLMPIPQSYQTCNPKDLGILISNMLLELIRLNDQIPLRDGRLTRFHSRAPPGISVADYLQRLIHHATLSPPILLSMVWYIDRLCQLYPAFTINSLTVHRFLITAACVAAKGLSDSFWTNPTYAKIGGIPVSELATLELEFLQKVAWKIVPKPEVLVDYYSSLVERTEGFELEGGEGGGGEGSGNTSADESEDGEGEKDEDEVMADEVT
ncbi:Pho80p cyclin [Vermiconidia calcicola]|uniref:Pho80p cyclin n=1 Tax=Vermiconidia calcicola TaxID=1690605 RepID=A0ACC3NP00_9PEZI|nr:Pho80p cyclin [Vermiconidia calcicola]